MKKISHRLTAKYTDSSTIGNTVRSNTANAKLFVRVSEPVEYRNPSPTISATNTPNTSSACVMGRMTKQQFSKRKIDPNSTAFAPIAILPLMQITKINTRTDAPSRQLPTMMSVS